MTAEDFRKRECGECNFCCSAPAIEESKFALPLTGPKPATDPCEYCEVKGGCRIYEKRPEVCREYLCTYATGHTEHRPDLVGVCWSFQEVPAYPGRWMLTGHALDSEAVLADERNWDPIGNALRRGAAAVVVRDARIAFHFSLFGGRVVSRECEIDPADPMKVLLLPETEKPSRYQIEIQIT